MPKKTHPPLIELAGGSVRIADVVLPRSSGPRSPGCPGPEAFRSFCVDGVVANTLRRVALAVRQRKPFCLRGPTGASKTTLTEFLAMLLGRPVLSATLSSETRVADLIGRFIPRDPLAQLPVGLEELQAQEELLGERSRRVLRVAREAGRGLTRLEVSIVRSEQDLPLQPLTWQDGVIPGGMASGAIVVLNEANLAPTEVLERFNPVFEPRRPSLLMAEYDGRSLTPGNGGVHPDFLVCGTLNPESYTGRRAFSTALADRFSFIEVPAPGEDELRRLARWAVVGLAEPVVVQGTTYSVPSLGASRHDVLASIPGIERAVDAVARLHSDLATAARRPQARDGAGREQSTFSRRLLVDFLDFLEAEAAASPIDSLRRFEDVVLDGVDFAYSRRGVGALGPAAFAAILAAHGLARNHRVVFAAAGACSRRRLDGLVRQRTGLLLDDAYRMSARGGAWTLDQVSGLVAGWWVDLFAGQVDMEVRGEAA